jgi:uncharacterized protein with NAD-binding domain and iron-sulfur cluster
MATAQKRARGNARKANKPSNETSNEPSSQPSNDDEERPAYSKVATPASRLDGRRRPDRPKVAVFGAGIAGLTAAHELAERGFKVTVYEPERDTRPRNGAGAEKDWPPPVRLGGIAATQFITANELHDFRGTPGERPRPACVTGEHGFRFFPAYYLHIWDTLRRIPVYDGDQRTPRTVYDNVQRVIAQGATSANGQPSLVYPREAPRSALEMTGGLQQMLQGGTTPADLATFFERALRYLVTSPLRREDELEEISTYEYFRGYDKHTGEHQFTYSDAFDDQLQHMPRILAAFDSRCGDARTNLNTFIQLNMMLDRYDTKADGVLNGPTTTAWFDHWYKHLRTLEVDFVRAALSGFQLVGQDEGQQVRAYIVAEGPVPDGPAVPAPDADVAAKPRGKLVDAEYFVVATDGYRAQLATRGIRAAQIAEFATSPDVPLRVMRTREPHEGALRQRLRGLSNVIGLEGYATTRPPGSQPFGENLDQPRDPLTVKEVGVEKWDRFQNLSGIQFYFDTEFQVLFGHVYYANSDWALSSINQTGLWEHKPTLNEQGYVSIMSVDIGDWNTKSSHNHKRARDCSPEELAQEVWYQVATEFAASLGDHSKVLQLPRPRWFSVDQFVTFANGKPDHNNAPYLIPIVGDWKNRPGASPWNPNQSSPTWLPKKRNRMIQTRLKVWQAGHGGYLVHWHKLVFAGTWCKTFTRMTSMEAANESGRHAVNAILDHYLHKESDFTDARADAPLAWNMPFGFVDQDISEPVRFPTPAGDYCFITDGENREPGDFRTTRDLDTEYIQEGLAHPWTLWGLDSAAVSASRFASGNLPDIYDPSWITTQLREWRRVVNMVVQATQPAGSGRSATRGTAKFGWRRNPSRLGWKLRNVRKPSRPPSTPGGYLTPPNPFAPFNPYAPPAPPTSTPTRSGKRQPYRRDPGNPFGSF